MHKHILYTYQLRPSSIHVDNTFDTFFGRLDPWRRDLFEVEQPEQQPIDKEVLPGIESA